jgi:hypothetical protein
VGKAKSYKTLFLIKETTLDFHNDNNLLFEFCLTLLTVVPISKRQGIIADKIMLAEDR